MALGHAKHLPGFRLANGNRLNTAAVNFGKIAGVIDDKRHHRRQQAAIGAGTPGTGKAHQTGAKVDNDDLQHQRRATDDPHKGFDHAPQRCEPAHGAK